jgi:hypothetical protein
MTRIQYTGIKKDGAFRVVSADNFKKELADLPDGRYRVTVDKARKNKSNPQLGYLFSTVYPFVLKFLNDAGYEFTSLEEVDAFCKARFASRDIINRHTGEIITIPDLKRNFTTMDMMTYIEAIRQYCAEYLGGYIPEPNEQMTIEL